MPKGTPGKVTCSVSGCTRDCDTYGLCRPHAQRLRRHGDVGSAEILQRGTATDRFWAKVDRSGGPDACWPWLGTTNGVGYGMFWVSTDRGRALAHRWAWEAANGPIPAGHDLDHRCHDTSCVGGVACSHRLCVNPAHCAPATRRENLRRGISANGRKTTCPRGHVYDYVIPSTGGRTCRACRHLS